MSELLTPITNIPAPFNMVVMIVLIVCIAGMVTGVAKEIRKFFCHRQEIEFKRELVDRGLGGDEIERIMAASIGSNEKAPVTVNGNYQAPPAAQAAKA